MNKRMSITNRILSIILTLALIASAGIVVPTEANAATSMPYASDETVIGCGSLDRFGRYEAYAYHLRDSATNGVSFCKNNPINYEAFCGMHITCNNSKITCTFYNNSDYNINSGKITIRQLNNDNIYNVGDVTNQSNTQTFDMTNVIKYFNITGLSSSIGYEQKKKPDEYGVGYELIPEERTMEIFEAKIDITSGTLKDQSAKTYIYYDGKTAQTCWITDSADIQNTIKTWNNLVGKIDPNKCLSMYVMNNKNYPITYPTSGTGGACNHVKLWQDRSETLISNDNWSDELKVYVLINHLFWNYAYDEWRVQINDNQSRAMKYNDWDNDELWMYYNGVGQCWDFGNVMTIMCRQQGIPCTTIDNNHHTVNIVWLDDEWIAIDVSDIVCYENWNENPDKTKWEQNQINMGAYGYYETNMYEYNQGLATPGTTLDTGGGNPM